MKLVVNEFVTLDGVVQAPGGPDEDRDGGFQYGGWSAPYFDDEMGRTVGESMEHASAFLLGRKTYDIFAGYWPNATEDLEIADLLNRLPKYVGSRTLKDPSWQNTSVLSGDVSAAIAKLKERGDGEMQVAGSSNFLQSIHPLVDEYRLWICPVSLGGGKRLFEHGSHALGLELVESRTNSKGAIYAVYRPAGPVQTGQMGG
jgi:dihydrofolate reductase